MYTNPKINFNIGDTVETTNDFKTAFEEYNTKAKYKASTYLKGKIIKLH